MKTVIAEISIDEYQEQFAKNDPALYVLVDVREEYEYEAGHLANAINIPMSEFQWRVNEITTEKPVVLVCASGGRSAMVAEFMATQGYNNGLYNLVDGTMGWMMRGLPLEAGE